MKVTFVHTKNPNQDYSKSPMIVNTVLELDVSPEHFVLPMVQEAVIINEHYYDVAAIVKTYNKYGCKSIMINLHDESSKLKDIK